MQKWVWGKKQGITVTDTLKNHKKVTSLYFALLCGVWLHLFDPLASKNTWDEIWWEKENPKCTTRNRLNDIWHSHFHTWLQGSNKKVGVRGATISWQTCSHHTHTTIFKNNKKRKNNQNYCTVKDALNRNNLVLLMCIPVGKINQKNKETPKVLIWPSQKHGSQFGRFHKYPYFIYFRLINSNLYQYI